METGDQKARIKEEVDRIGKRIAELANQPKYMDGEVLICLGYRDEDEKCCVICFPGTYIHSEFKEKVMRSTLNWALEGS